MARDDRAGFTKTIGTEDGDIAQPDDHQPPRGLAAEQLHRQLLRFSRYGAGVLKLLDSIAQIDRESRHLGMFCAGLLVQKNRDGVGVGGDFAGDIDGNVRACWDHQDRSIGMVVAAAMLHRNV